MPGAWSSLERPRLRWRRRLIHYDGAPGGGPGAPHTTTTSNIVGPAAPVGIVTASEDRAVIDKYTDDKSFGSALKE